MLPRAKNSKALSLPSSYTSIFRQCLLVPETNRNPIGKGIWEMYFTELQPQLHKAKYKMVGSKLKPQVNSQYSSISIFSILGFKFLD